MKELKGHIRRASLELVQAAIQFVRAAHSADEYLLVEFRDHLTVTLRFTTITEELVQRIGDIEAGASTALFDAIRLASQFHTGLGIDQAYCTLSQQGMVINR
jgi:hypothetical protein